MAFAGDSIIARFFCERFDAAASLELVPSPNVLLWGKSVMKDLTTYGLPVPCHFQRQNDHIDRSIRTLLSTNVLGIWMDAIPTKSDSEGSFENENWDALLDNCRAVTDISCAVIESGLGALVASTDNTSQASSPELTTTYAEAKVIMSNPRVQIRFQSTLNTIHQGMVS